jgi:hypothetical protein
MQLIGHRGSRACLPENTVEAALYSIKHGATCIEIDLDMCATGEIVVTHDHHTRWKAFKDSGPSVVRLRTFLSKIPGHVAVYLDVKNYQVVDRLEAELTGFGNRDLWFASFDPISVEKAKEKVPCISRFGIICSVLPNNWGNTDIDFYSVDVSFGCGYVGEIAEVMARNKQVYYWTVNHPKELEGLPIPTGIVTDDPFLFKGWDKLFSHDNTQ